MDSRLDLLGKTSQGRRESTEGNANPRSPGQGTNLESPKAPRTEAAKRRGQVDVPFAMRITGIRVIAQGIRVSGTSSIGLKCWKSQVGLKVFGLRETSNSMHKLCNACGCKEMVRLAGTHVTAMLQLIAEAVHRRFAIIIFVGPIIASVFQGLPVM